ncbi:cell division protein FtsX [Qipengyuania sediminis]|uniref:cell division protein FtsX n=1 Tax=Qipengyuania sediminis TaxID=1532023 RepID=UPI00105A568F|nr:cell division protein [Qipengyuania sediminis]
MRRPPVFAGARGLAFSRKAGAEVLPRARLRGPMPWVIAIMVALSVLATGGALALANFAARAEAGLAGGLTVQIVEAEPAVRDARQRAVLRLLETDPDVAATAPVAPEKLATLVEPWLGDSARGAGLTMPALIEVRLAPAAGGDVLPRLSAALARVAPGARVDADAAWLGPVFDAIDALRWLAAALLVLLTLASAAAVWLAARNAFDVNRATIEIVHHLGASDAQIAALFQRWVLGGALLGGLIGLALGAGALALLGRRFAALQSGTLANGALAPGDWLLVAAVPAITALVALVTARGTVMARLRAML